MKKINKKIAESFFDALVDGQSGSSTRWLNIIAMNKGIPLLEYILNYKDLVNKAKINEILSRNKPTRIK